MLFPVSTKNTKNFDLDVDTGKQKWYINVAKGNNHNTQGGVRKVSIDKLDLLMGIFAAFGAGVGTGMIIILAIAENTFSSFKEDRIKRKQKAAYRHEQRRK